MDVYNSNPTNGERSSDDRDTQRPYPPSYYAQNSDSGRYNTQQDGSYRWSYEDIRSGGMPPPEKKPRKNRGLRVFATVVAAIALVVMGGFATYGAYVAATGNTFEWFSTNPNQNQSSSQPGELPQVIINDRPGSSPTMAEDGGLSNNEIYKKVSPSIVGIVSYVTTSNGYFSSESQGQGSGIIMSSDGYIITNEHVVSGANRIEVVTADGETYTAQLIGGDTQTDLAVVKIEAVGLPVAEFGNSDQLEVGERVVAIGNPGGLQFANSLTVGYVSALNRILATGETGYALECIQTDAAINPGNSGGALINAYGQIVGINSAKMRTTQNYEGMGFAIPINDATPILQDIIQNGKVTGRAMLGITAQAVGATEAQMSGIPMGLRISSFSDGNDLERQGVQVGDIVTHINNTPIYTTTGSADVLKQYAPGDTVTISIYRRDVRGRSATFNIDVVLISS